MRTGLVGCVALIVVLSGCGGGTVGLTGVDAVTDGGPEDSLDIAGRDGRGEEDAAGPEVDVVVPVDLVILPDVSGEISDVQEEDNCCPEKGATGDPCFADGQCESGLCISQDGLGMCTEDCAPDCPEGWSCLNAPWSGVDVMFVCFPDAAVLCRPCLGNDDCEPAVEPFVGSPSFCMNYGVEGAYCALPCSSDDDCTKGYQCESWFDVDGNAVDGCRKASGICDCSPLSVVLGAQTSCKVGNEFGACSGERFCGDEGLTECDGAQAEAEACNGVDDDCDGEVDEETGGEQCEDENAYGICKGQEKCLDGELICDAPVPAPEACDGLDNDCNGIADEGFPDVNDNGIVDCLESDVDEDGIFDYDDNCPDLANPGQEDNESDGLGDLCDDDDDNDGVADDDDCAPFDGTVSPATEEACNGQDDNCDGEVDEGFGDSNGDGVADCVEVDSDGDAVFDYEDNCPEKKNPDQKNSDDDESGDACDDDDDNDSWLDDDDCGPTDPDVFPDAPEVCNGVDDNCDGGVDENLAMQTCGLGICANTVLGCDGGVVIECLPLDVAGEEVCDGLDNNCDGEVDEGFGTSTCGQGVCAVEAPNCLGGAPNACVPLDIAGPEKCDGQDNDCDGEIDEELGMLTCGMGVCANEVAACEDGAVGFCQPLANGGDETCDELDNDCDGLTDEGSACQECHTESYGEHLYLFCTLNANWPAARAVCLAEDMDLASSSSAEEDAWMYGKAIAYEQASGWWFGYADSVAEGQFIWASGEQPGFVNWKAGEPNDADGVWGEGEDCGSVVAWGGSPGWNDLHCTHWSLPYICEDIDTDGDGVPNRIDDDDDGDGVADAVDNCPLALNPEQVDIDGDGLGGPCDDDDDGDGDLDPTDCAPADPTIHAGAAEACDDVDNNCDGIIDGEGSQGCQAWYLDADEDTWGISESACLCAPVAPYTAEDMGDCDDTNKLANPDETEACGDDFDNDCDATTNCFWVTVGDAAYGFEPVITESAAEAFYSYSSGSSHTGYEVAELTRFMIHQGPDGTLSLVFLNDAVNDADGGDVDVTIKSGIGDAAVIVSDDAGEVEVNNKGDFHAKWKWVTCCTDGAVLGPLDGAAGLEIPVEVKLQAGVVGAEMVSGGQAAIPLGSGNFSFTIHKAAD